MFRGIWISLCSACALILFNSASAQDIERLKKELGEAPFTLTADHVTYESDRDLYEASGNVRMEQPGGTTLTADWITFNSRTRIGIATGNVRIREGGDVLEAEFATIDLDTLDALATDAVLQTGERGFVVRAEELRKTGAARYEVDSGNFTTCRCPPGTKRLPWEINVGQADVEIGGYAKARDVSVCVLGVPIAYTPYLLFPVKTKRQTGFLFPRISTSSRDGFSLEAPFFWAPREDLNILLRPNWISKRGFKNAVEYEFVFGERAHSSGGAALLPGDNLVEDDDPETPYSDDRWAYWLRHEQPFGRGQRFGADVHRASDNDYPVDFEDLDNDARSVRYLESQAWGTHARGSYFAGAEVDHFDDLQSPNDLDRDDFVLQRVPDARLGALARPILNVPILGALDLRYTYFAQTDGRRRLDGQSPVRGVFFDTGIDGLFDPHEPNPAGGFGGGDNDLDNGITEGNGLFEEGELVADYGHRAELYPRFVLPAQLGILEGLAELGYRATFYNAKEEGADARGLVTGRLDTRTRFQRGFRLRSLDLRHILEPNVAFAFVSARNQNGNPLFIPESRLRQERLIDADVRLLTRNPSDRVEDERYLEVGLGNRLWTGPGVDGSPPREVASLRFGSGYDFELDRVTNVFGEATFDPAPWISFKAQLGVDPKESRVEEALGHVGWSATDRFNLGLDYRFLRDPPTVFEAFQRLDDAFDDFDPDFSRINQLGLTGDYRLSPRWQVFGSGYISFEDTASKHGRAGVRYSSPCKCWDLVSAVRRTSRTGDTRFELLLEFEGLGLFRR